MFKGFAAVCFTVYASATLAQGALYRCGSTFSQTPCGAEQQQLKAPSPSTGMSNDSRPPLPAPPDRPVSAEVEERSKAMCRAAILGQLKDPDSAQFKYIKRGGTATWRQEPPVPVRYYWMSVNAKNAYGGYVGFTEYRCALRIDESTVLTVAKLKESDIILY